MSNGIIVNTRVSFRQRIGLLGLIACFVVMGTLRLNECDLFNPDSPRYVLYSQSIADLGEYRATDLPGAPVYSWRPPGLSLLLAPVMSVRPYDVIAAKTVVLLTGVLLLWVVFESAAIHSGGWAALLVAAVVATGPSFQVLSSEVLTEIPYTLGVLVVLWVLSRSTLPAALVQCDQTRWTSRIPMVVAVAALAYTPWLRTAGISLIAAVGLWVFASRSRNQWIPGFLLAAAAFGLLAWRNKIAGGENYIGSLATRLREQGLAAVFASGMETVWHYLGTLPGLLFPGFSSERAWYSPLSINELPSLGLPLVFTACAATMLVSLAVLGMCRRRASGGSLAILYLLIYVACLIVWPWRHERFVWPLIPVMMIYVPMGVSCLASWIPAIERMISVSTVTAMLALCGWQSVTCEQIVRVNQQFVRDQNAFHATRYPGFYFSNWRRAGDWLNAHSEPSARVLTWHAAVGSTSHRFQKRVQFEALSPEKLRHEIEQFAARYLVVLDTQFGDGFHWAQIAADPAIQLNVVYREQGVAVLEVTPNRTGTISKEFYPEWLQAQLRLAELARERDPGRVDVAIRYAGLLHESGRLDEGIPVLRDLLAKGAKTVRVCAELGWMLYENELFADAAKYLDMARTLPNSESISQELAEGAIRARKKQHEAVSAKVAAERQLTRVKSLLGQLKYQTAEQELDRFLAQNAEHPEALFMRGRLYHRLGDDSRAENCLDKAMQMGVNEAQHWLFAIRYCDAIQRQTASMVVAGDRRELVNPSDPAAHIRAAKLLVEHGWAGRALATLETANDRFVNQPEIQMLLAEGYVRFGRPELAIPFYASVLKQHSTDEAAKTGLETAQSRMLSPMMRSTRRVAVGNSYASRDD